MAIVVGDLSLLKNGVTLYDLAILNAVATGYVVDDVQFMTFRYIRRRMGFKITTRVESQHIHDDWKERVRTSLKRLQRAGLIDYWQGKTVCGGRERRSEGFFFTRLPLDARGYTEIDTNVLRVPCSAGPRIVPAMTYFIYTILQLPKGVPTSVSLTDMCKVVASSTQNEQRLVSSAYRCTLKRDVVPVLDYWIACGFISDYQAVHQTTLKGRQYQYPCGVVIRR